MVNNYNIKAMRKFKNIYWAAMVVLTLLLSQNIVAQDVRTSQMNPASIELLKANSLWFNTDNGAGLVLDKMHDFNNLILNYNFKSGDFKRRADGENERLFGVSTEGGLNLGGGYVWGEFSYNNEKQKNTLYNTTMLDPTRGMPYYVVDKNLSDWVKQNYNLHMKISSKPLFGKVLIGLEASYNTKTGAKQIDPRSETNFYTINVKPGAVANFGRHAIGLNFDYERLSQESSTTNSNNNLNQDVWVMKGLGNSYSAVIGGLQSLGKFVYDGNKVGGAFQYSFVGESVKLLFDGKYYFRVEDVISTPSKPKKQGTVKENNYEANLQFLAKTEDILSRAELSYKDNKINGIEYVQYLDNSYEVQGWVVTYQSIRSTFSVKDVSFKYDLFKGNGFDYDWRGGLSLDYRNSDDLYIIPESVMKMQNFILGANAKGNFNMGKGKLLAGLSFDYKRNLSDKYVYGGANPDSHIITDFMTPDFQYLTRNYCKFGGELSYFTGVSKTKNIGMYVKAALDYYKPTEGSDNRLLTGFSVGFNF